MPESFGARMRRTREEQQITLVTIAQQTKIKLSLLEGLERDDVSHWPSGIFRRAYIRTYAQAIGLNPDVVVREFIEAHTEPAEVVTTDAIASAVGARTNAGPPTRLRNIVGSALGSLSKLRRSPTPEEAVAPQAIQELAFAGPSPEAFSLVEMADDAGPDVGVMCAPEPPLPEPAASPIMDEVDVPSVVFAMPPPAREEPRALDVQAIAQLCTDLGRVRDSDDVKPLLAGAARLLEALGLIVWIWDDSVERLRPALAHGYSDKVLAHIPALRHNADNATAAAFRTARPCAIEGNADDSGALVIPLRTYQGCLGVLAIELQRTPDQSARAVATIIAAAVAQLVARSRATEAPREEESNARIAEAAEQRVRRAVGRR